MNNKTKKRNFVASVFLLAGLAILYSQQDVVMSIKGGIPAIPVAIPNFVVNGSTPETKSFAETARSIITDNLKYSRVFNTLPNSYYSYIRPLDPQKIFFKDWESIQAKLLFVGEAPGRDEDIQGRPFVGKAGQLLTRIISAMEFDREDVYITNVVKCRPPNNRTPNKEEIEECKNFLLEQIEMIKPKVVVALGKVATDFFVHSSQGMTALRGNFHEFNGIHVMPTFHPSYLIRNEGNKSIKKMVWEDMKKVMALLGKK